VIQNTVSSLRLERGLTQQELADRLRVTRQTIISLEKNRYTPSLEMAFKVADLFGKPIEEVFTYQKEARK
jgi:putative transcriptional regulator